MTNIKAATQELHKAFGMLNQHFFEGTLPEPAITIQTSGKRLAMGWCTTQEAWFDKEGLVGKYELNISAEYLNIEFMETMDTLLHEMVHLYCKVNKIKDTSRNHTYHNAKFKEECLKRGFYFSDDKPHKSYGWAFPKLTEDSKAVIGDFDLDQDVFVIARKRYGKVKVDGEEGQGKERETKKSFKWVCPGCSLIIRSTKETIKVICGECHVPLELSE